MKMNFPYLQFRVSENGAHLTRIYSECRMWAVLLELTKKLLKVVTKAKANNSKKRSAAMSLFRTGLNKVGWEFLRRLGIDIELDYINRVIWPSSNRPQLAFCFLMERNCEGCQTPLFKCLPPNMCTSINLHIFLPNMCISVNLHLYFHLINCTQKRFENPNSVFGVLKIFWRSCGFCSKSMCSLKGMIFSSNLNAPKIMFLVQFLERTLVF